MNYIPVESLVTVLLNSETQYGLGSSCCVAGKLLQGGYENDGVCAAGITRLWNRYSLGGSPVVSKPSQASHTSA